MRVSVWGFAGYSVSIIIGIYMKILGKTKVIVQKVQFWNTDSNFPNTT